jgi:hypothetical protein
MRNRLQLILAAAIVVGAVGAGASPAAAATPSRTERGRTTALAAVTLASTIALNNCSASLVRYPTSVSTDRGLMLTNGHCFEGGFLSAGQVLLNRASSRTGRLLNAAGTTLGTVRADRVLYATMTNTDVTLYRLTDTYAALTSRFGATALTISRTHPSAGAVGIPSGFFSRIFNCSLTAFVPTLREGSWTWHDSLKYNTGCNTIHGTSGSPIVDVASGMVVGINNTGNDNGERCTLNNPCEVDQSGRVTVIQGQSYGQETFWFTTCLTPSNVLDLNVAGCQLTKPAAARASRG